MNIKEKLQKIVKENSKIFEKNKSFKQNNDYYKQLKKQGIIIKNEYTIPLSNNLGQVNQNF